MEKYDELFHETAPDNTLFTDKSELDPLTDPGEISARRSQERKLATLLNGIHDGYLPPLVSVYGPPGTGKTLTTRRICREFATRQKDVAAEYVNLKECHTLFSAANEILSNLTGEKKGAYEGLDGVFAGIWKALEEYPDWTVLILDEVDHIRQDTNYDPSDFFYRLLRGEGKLERGINLSVWLISNELIEEDLRLDSRVESARSDEKIFFPPYNEEELSAILTPRLKRAFQEGVISEEVRLTGVQEAARRWGDARKALTLFRQAGETASERELEYVTKSCLEANLESANREATIETLLNLSFNHFLMLIAITARQRGNKIEQPVTTAQIHEYVCKDSHPKEFQLGKRTIRNLITDLETMGLVNTWIKSRGRKGRVKQIETTFDPQLVHEAMDEYLSESSYLASVVDL